MILGMALLAVAIGCSTPQERYRVLSVFFDGVPNPDAKSQSLTRKTSSGQTIIVHKPYADQKCDSCHLNTSDIFARAKVAPDVCIRCHGEVQSGHKIIHGPVAVNMCLTCHSPHHSIQPHLLKTAPPKVCIQCHDQTELTKKVPEHADPKSSCITCHSGHGGNDRNFLKLAAPATLPTTQAILPPRPVLRERAGVRVISEVRQ